MSTATMNPVQNQAVQSVMPQMILWTIDQFHDLCERGLFEGRRAMLIDGIIVEEGPMNSPHAIAATLLENLLNAVLLTNTHMRIDKPFTYKLMTDLKPDIVIVQGSPRDYTVHPTTAVMIAEIADTSLAFDLGWRMSAYASSKVADYWVLDINNNQLIVHRDPQPDATQVHGHGYATVQIIPATGSVSPLAMPSAILRVQDMLP